MRRWVRAGATLLALALVAGLGAWWVWLRNPYQEAPRLDPARLAAQPGDLLIRGATWVDVSAGRLVPDTSFRIEGGRITERVSGWQLEPPPGAPVLEAEGAYAMPGLVDVHAHLGSGGISEADAAAVRWSLEQYLRSGVTTILVLGSRGGNDEQAAELKRAERAGEIVAPRILATGDLLTDPGSHPITTLARLSPDTPPDVLHARGITAIREGEDPEPIVRRKAELGLDAVKIIVESGPGPFQPKPRISRETATRIVAAAERHGLDVYVHATSPEEVLDAVRAGAHAIVHSVEDADLDAAQLEEVRAAGVHWAATLSIFHGFAIVHGVHPQAPLYEADTVSRRALRSLQHPLFRIGIQTMASEEQIARALETAGRNLVALHRAGVPIALGTDSSMPYVFPGYSAHVEMELMAEAGLAPVEVLRAATVGGADALGLEDEIGTLAPGRAADLLLLDADPLAEVAHSRRIRHVIARGRVVE